MSVTPPALGDREKLVELDDVPFDTHTGKAAEPHDLTVGQNVTVPIPDEVEATSAKISPKNSPSSEMRRVVNLADLDLHSPSQIIGTPFAVNSSRFEYPFPESPSSGSQSSLSPSHSLPTISSSAFSTSIPGMPSLSPPSNSLFHPKLKLDKEPPIPPGLVKKQRKWSLGLLARRRESYESNRSEDSATSAGSVISIEPIPEPDAGHVSPLSGGNGNITNGHNGLTHAVRPTDARDAEGQHSASGT